MARRTAQPEPVSQTSDGLTIPMEVQALREPAPEGPHLVELSGEHRGRIHALDAPATTIGRKRGLPIRLVEAGVSKEHCSLLRAGSAVSIVDHHSTNGTLLNGRPLSPDSAVALAHGDTVQVVQTLFLFMDRRQAEGAGAEEIAIDRATVAAEAARLLKENPELHTLRRSRRA